MGILLGSLFLQDYVMLTQWLPGGENKLPPNASHQV